MAIVHEFHHNLLPKFALAPVVVADNTAQVTAIVDLQGVEFVELVIVTGAIADADATFAITGTQGNVVDNAAAPTVISDATAIDPSCLIGTLADAGFNFASDNAVKSVGYNPNKGGGARYVRFTVTPTGNAAAAPMAAIFLVKPLQLPVGR